MDDFLYNLRRETDKRNRRQSGQQNYRGPDRRGMKDQRRNYNKRNEALEVIPEVKTLLETLVENQKKILENDDRKTQALEKIAAVLGASLPEVALPDIIQKAPETSPEPEPAETEAPPVAATEVESPQEDLPAEKADGDSDDVTPARSNREDVRKIALSLREEGKTYKEIAQYLEDNNIPTFSGKGGWHAPTIHKLCK